MEEKKEKGNFWLTVATFIVNKRKAIYVLFFYCCNLQRGVYEQSIGESGYNQVPAR